MVCSLRNANPRGLPTESAYLRSSSAAQIGGERDALNENPCHDAEERLGKTLGAAEHREEWRIRQRRGGMAASVTGLTGTSGIHKTSSPAAVSFSLAAVQKRQRWDPGSHFTGEASGAPLEGLPLAQAVHRQAQHQSF